MSNFNYEDDQIVDVSIVDKCGRHITTYHYYIPNQGVDAFLFRFVNLDEDYWSDACRWKLLMIPKDGLGRPGMELRIDNATGSQRMLETKYSLMPAEAYVEMLQAEIIALRGGLK